MEGPWQGLRASHGTGTAAGAGAGRSESLIQVGRNDIPRFGMLDMFIRAKRSRAKSKIRQAPSLARTVVATDAASFTESRTTTTGTGNCICWFRITDTARFPPSPLPRASSHNAGRRSGIPASILPADRGIRTPHLHPSYWTSAGLARCSNSNSQDGWRAAIANLT